MRILKIFGVVVGIHVFALVLIFANPGCSSTTKPIPAPIDTVAQSAPAPTIHVPGAAAAAAPEESPAHITFNPDAPATAASGASSGGVRFVPTRPGTAAAGTLVSEPVLDVTPASTYTVVPGDNLSKIAKKHNTTIAELAVANSMKPNAMLRPGQKLLIPGKPASPTVPSAPNPGSAPAKYSEPAAARVSGAAFRHVVKTGETLGAIARMYDVRQGDIAVANNISDPAKIKAGTELIIPGWDSPAPKSGKSTQKSTPAAKKSSEPKPQPALDLEPAEPGTPPPPAVPVIRIDDNPIAPAPRN
jgi:LysM repeat protein